MIGFLLTSLFVVGLSAGLLWLRDLRRADRSSVAMPRARQLRRAA